MEEDLFGVLEKSNQKIEKPVDIELLKQIISIVIKNPLVEDRPRCQEQIYTIVKQNLGRR